MKRSQDVYFFTLIDLLLQLLFVAVVVWVIDRATPEPCADGTCIAKAPIQKLAEKNGFSTITQLMDYLTRLSPLGGADSAIIAVREAGGVDSVRLKTRMLDSLLRGVGLPPCRSIVTEGRRRAVAEGRLIALDDSITVVSMTDAIGDFSDGVGRSYSLREFVRRFSDVKSSTCLHYVEVLEKTKYIYARDAIGTIFGRIPVR